MKTKRKNNKTLMIYVPDIIHAELKSTCHEQGIPLTGYVVRAIISRLNLERSADKKLKI